MAAADRAVAATATATVELDGALQGWKKKVRTAANPLLLCKALQNRFLNSS